MFTVDIWTYVLDSVSFHTGIWKSLQLGYTFCEGEIDRNLKLHIYSSSSKIVNKSMNTEQIAIQ